MRETVKIGVFGLGGRGQSLVEYAILPACQDMDVEIAAVYDPYEDRTQEGAAIVERITGKRPLAAKNEDEIFNNADIRAVIISSSWESHIDLAISFSYNIHTNLVISCSSSNRISQSVISDNNISCIA